LDENIIVGGDFNTVLEHNLDKMTGRIDSHTKCRRKINDIMQTINLVDIW